MTTKNGPRALLIADTDRTLDYVFESARLPEIRGGSNILLELNEQTAPKLIKSIDGDADIIYAAGGCMLCMVTADKAQAIQQTLEALYPRETGVATITCVYRELPESIDVDQGVPRADVDDAHLDALSPFQRRRWEQADRELGNFGAWVRLLGHDLRRRKQEKRYVPFVEAPPHAERCQSCRLLPAATLNAHYGESMPRCVECAKKNRASPRFPWRDIFEGRLRDLHKDDPELIENYFAGAEKGTVPLDIGVIASACQPRNPNKRGYVAFIYADGDGVGSFVESRRTRKEYQDMSKKLRDATWYAVTFALANNLAIQPLDNPMSSDESEEERRRPTQPFEIITVGGDDVMLIVPAHVALQVAHDMARAFTEYLERKGVNDSDKDKNRPLTLSAGVVIAPEHMPVRLMRDFARELLKESAKPRAKDKDTECAAVDFQIFTSTAVYGTDVMRQRSGPPYAIAPPGEDGEKARPLRLHHRPYTIEELDRLLRALDALNREGFPTSQLYPLAEALEQGRRRATLFYLYQRSRLNTRLRRALEQVEAIVEFKKGRDPLPWYKADSNAAYAFSTTLRDVAELYDFVPELETKEVTA